MKLKICGMKYQENVAEVGTLHPDYLGFIFYEKSSRFFNGTLPELPKEIKKVGVFVNASVKEIKQKIAHYNLDLVQLHGEESPEFCQTLMTDLSKKIEIIKVFSVNEQFNFNVLKPYEAVCDYFLFDTKGRLPGGNGYTFNWDVLIQYPSTKPYFLSGGIGLEEMENIKQFMQGEASKYCYAIDVNSQFEIAAGLKDYKKLKEFKNHITSSDFTAH
ncbi:phosphoribosylanthranilate isomerase [Gelidibacter salicanalis]|uniref:N-(5'-phosphoribosyl)anthranilate isomerase n=1 Tax=Gelidibacter salicanalis TaxID=291193 RepID=A0A934KN40_9FLAO|nr:phosphoribosylanthranilate isomerase [Gelidibacter salicanalis]MBJ7882396.1 phosphoribosylanthranilate isomerase [Gelidibacter salicanalis]